MRLAKALLLASTFLSTSGLSALAEINVVTSIKPVHSLVSAVMEGVGEPGLIVDGAGSPHNFAMKPSQAQMLESANVIFWVSHELEAFLEKPLETVGANAKSVEMMDAHDLVKLSFREGGAFEKHNHEDHDEEGHSDEAKSHDDDHDHDHDHDKEETAKKDDHEGHEHGKYDAHIWLDPANAKAMIHEIEEVLVAADPQNAKKYEANAEQVMARLDTLINEVSATLEPVKDNGFIVFHDGYQYFENRFGVTASGSITVSPEVLPGAERLTEIRSTINELGATCVFAEPQFEPKLVTTVTEGTKAKSAVLDPLGTSLKNGAQLYFDLIRNMASSVKTCLSKAS
mgnify:CR=1 FL=1